ncbi:hypothetical protein [Pseudoduganella sp. R-34]|uniref:hypothetical protein n=1 Tax=Pseudoduganella sp. R-34 TaxID=3404062 RepID=UPI003CF8CCDD
MQKLLDKAKHCAVCGDLMAAGDVFRLAEKQIKDGSRVGAYKTVFRPAHVDENCIGQKYDREQKLAQANNYAGAIQKLREVGAPGESIAEVRAIYLEQLDCAEYAQIVQSA